MEKGENCKGCNNYIKNLKIKVGADDYGDYSREGFHERVCTLTI
jgi:hypothetical protein